MGELRMSIGERDRLDVFGRVKRNELTVVAAAGLSGIARAAGRRRATSRRRGTA